MKNFKNDSSSTNKNNLFIIISFIILCLIILGLLFYKIRNNKLSNDQKFNHVNISVEDVSNTIKNSIVFKDDLQEVSDEDTLKRLYPSFDIKYIESYSVFVSASGAKAEEIAVFKLANKIYFDDMEKIIRERLDNQLDNFKNYIPDEVYKLENAVINQNKDYNILTFVVCDTSDEVDITLKNLYNNN